MKVDDRSVIQRQLWLLQHNPLMKRPEAYDQARKEFYHLRLQQDVERRVAKEEALATGAQFGMSVNEIGVGLEDAEHQRWMEWAKKEIERINLRSTATTDYTSEEVDPELEAEEVELPLEESNTT